MRFICKFYICAILLCVQTFQYVIRGPRGLWPTGSNWAADHSREFQAAISAGYVLISDRQEW